MATTQSCSSNIFTTDNIKGHVFFSSYSSAKDKKIEEEEEDDEFIL